MAATMIVHMLRNTWKDLVRKHDKVDVKALGTPFYQQTKPPVIVRWAWPLVFANVLIAVVGADTAWNRWTMPVEPEPKPSNGTSSNSAEPPNWVLRPSWQRLGLIAGETAFCSVVISILVGSSGRAVRRMWVVPYRPHSPNTQVSKHGSGPLHIFVQTFGSSGSRAYIYPRSRASLTTQAGVDDLRLDLKQKDASVIPMYLQKEHALINGERVTSNEVQKVLMERFGMKPQERPTLRTGPIQPRA